MRIHTKLSFQDILRAIRDSEADTIDTITTHRSMTHDRAFRVYLSGDSPYRAQRDRSSHAASWDQWGIFLGAVFELDPEAKTDYYRNAAHFHAVTGHRFDRSQGGLRSTSDPRYHRRHAWWLGECKCGAMVNYGAEVPA